MAKLKRLDKTMVEVVIELLEFASKNEITVMYGDDTTLIDEDKTRGFSNICERLRRSISGVPYDV